MSDPRRRRLAAGRRRAVAGAIALAGALAGATAPAPAIAAPQHLTGWVSAASAFPQRTLVLVPPAGTVLTPARVHVTDDGSAAPGLTVTRVTAAARGGLGVMLVVDDGPGMRGAGLGAAVAAGRRLAAQRFPGEAVGLVRFGARTDVALAPTTDATALRRALAGVTATATAGAPTAAVSAALARLRAARVALGAIVVISDGGGVPNSAGDARAALAAAAGATHTPVITIGVRDASATTASLQALRQALPGQFTTVAPGGLPALISAIQGGLGGDYLVSYRSTAPAGRPVAARVTVDGVPGAVSATLQGAPSAPAGHGTAGHGTAGQGTAGHGTAGQGTLAHEGTSQRLAPPRLSRTAPLSRTPAFLTALPARGGSSPKPATASAPATSPAGAFWGTPRAAVAVAGACALLLTLGLWALLYRPVRRTVRTRIESFIPVEEAVVEEPLIAKPVTRSGVFARLQRGSWWPPFVEKVEIARLKASPSDLVKRAAVAAVLAGVLLGLASGVPLLGILPVLAWPFALRSFVNRALAKQRMKFGDSLPSYLQDLASSIRVGRSFVGALSVVAESADEPTRGEFERATTNEALGLPLEECLEAVSRRMASSDMDQVALIAGLNRRSGSNVAESLDRVAEGSRERADLRREMRALTAQAKMSSFVLTALPGVLLLGLSVISPMYAHPLFHTTLGVVALGMGAVMCFSGWKVMKKITNVDTI